MAIWINQIKQPIESFYETKKYQSLLENAYDLKTLILHCYGLPGAGKSETLLKLGAIFPHRFTSDDKTIKWQLNFKSSSDDERKELKQLLDDMRANSYFQNDIKYQEIIRGMANNIAAPFVDALQDSGAHILLIIEDKRCDTKFLTDLIRCVSNRQPTQNKFHIYMATRKKSAVSNYIDLSQCQHTIQEEINGFDQEEGIRFLLQDFSGLQSLQVDRKPAKDLFHRFSGSPLALQIAKAYCKKNLVTLSDYLEYLGKGLIGNDAKVLEKYTKSTIAIFDAITKPFEVQENLNKGAMEIMLWKVLSCLSYLHHDRIPRSIIERLCQAFRSTETDTVDLQNRIDSGEIITKLMDYAMCSFNITEGLVTFHEVIMHAVRLAQSRNGLKEFNALNCLVCVFSGLIVKDLRQKDTYFKMSQLIHHGQVLLDNVNQNLSLSKGNFFEHLLVRMVVSHLYETFGAIFLTRSDAVHNLSDRYFEKAYKIIWNDNDDNDCLLKPMESGRTLEEIAHRVVEQCYEAGKELPPEFITKYESNILNLKDCGKNEINFLKKNWTLDSFQFDNIVEPSTTTTNTCDQIKHLRRGGLFLKELCQQKVFFAERLASILHSWSRVILYKDCPDVEASDIYLWRSSLARAICVKCREIHRITLLTEYITIPSGKIPITLKTKKSVSELYKVKRFCEKALDANNEGANIEMYDHGLKKEYYGAAHPLKRISMLGHLVRIYSRLVKCESEDFREMGNKQCAILLTMANQYINELANAWMWIIHCAKYYAGSGQLTASLECYKNYFSHRQHIKESSSYNGHSWAVYNFARTVLVGKCLKYRDEAKTKCVEVLQRSEEISPEIRHKIQQNLKCLDQLTL
ncbi:uncharacterized protein LOC143462874 [Clavelina lepadiformis]|uniref:uncharacterized protein LOC143462874 n=1 Tax=Clavelina lepadiformis TaxID=159417 RepID=UPI004041F246